MRIKDLIFVKKERKLEFSPNLYWGEGMHPEDLGKLRKKLLGSPILTNVFLLTLPANDSDQIEAFSSRYLIQRYYGDNTVKVVGIAKDRSDAVSLIMKITEDCLSIRKDCLLKEFLEWQ